tara:strand:- start:21 stop:272 length:252 start_codon:yes stop_codon:yes gene_type:complete
MKITKKQLKKVNEGQQGLSTLVNQIGALETQKHSLLHQVAEANKIVEDFKKELEDEYGAVSIDLQTGECTPVEAEEDAKLEKA